MAEAKMILPSGTVVPDHIAMILDGNRRWARARELDSWKGHLYGYKALEKLAKSARRLGVHTFSVWAFSTENWERPQKEIDAIMDIFRKGLKEKEKEFHRDRVALIHLGRKDRLPEDIRVQLSRIEAETAKYRSHNVFNLAVDYGGKDEILRTVRKIVADGISAEKIDEKLFDSYLDTRDQPYPNPDLFIRTSGEQRTSGLMPWQMTYAEYYFEPDHLPDFTPEKLKEAILDYSRRRRRFGGNDKVKHLTFNPEVTARLEIAWWRLKNVPEGMRLRDYTMLHIKEQFGLSKNLAKDAALLMAQALFEEKRSKWDRATIKMRKFYKLVKDELKLAFEPKLVASLEVKMRRKLGEKKDIKEAYEAEETARELYAEVYRISLFQATKAAHLWVLANVERNLAEKGMGDYHWERAEDYLQKFYRALKERVA